ncbi:Lipid phosphate phosphatase 1 [Abeliophyllum distichum]|uniref:Lipid phosphate phosphatase 1 n=1 Tax=Abeliophyllum distichum TaxID=126358 RepID=A0ABD1PML6_9LAMI
MTNHHAPAISAPTSDWLCTSSWLVPDEHCYASVTIRAARLQPGDVAIACVSQGHICVVPSIHFSPKSLWQFFPDYIIKMPEVQFIGHTVKSHGSKLLRVHMHDWLILIVIAAIDAGLNAIEPFHRYVNTDMMTYLMYPLKIPDTVPMWAVPIIAVLLPCVIFLLYYFYKRDVYDLHYAVLGLLYSVLVSGVVTDSIKDAVGRPRPNFFYRCFPDGVGKDIKASQVGIPLGHLLVWDSSHGIYVGKFKCLIEEAMLQNFALFSFHYLFAILVAISRVDDYWHHFTDVIAGSMIGILASSFCYLQFFPFPHDINGWATHAFIRVSEENGFHSSYNRGQFGSSSRDASPDLDDVENGRRY